MKASTLFGMTIALLLGLGAVVGAKYLGYFEPAPAPEKKANGYHQVLIANRNLFKGTVASAADVKVRKLTEAEYEYFEKNRDKLLAAIESAVESRVLAKNVPAGTILFDDHFEKQAFPESVSDRLEPGMRSVHLDLPRERAAGGLLRVGERVDVLLTSTIHVDQAGTAPITATATIARNLKIIVKRDTLHTVMQGVPQDKPVAFMVQANPYRAALLEYVRLKGIITLVPTAMVATSRTGKEPMSDPDSKEYRDEDKRVSEFVNNEHIVSDADLERIFNVSQRLVPTAAPPPPPAKVEMMVGTRVLQTALVENNQIISRHASNAANAKGANASAANEQPAEPTSELAGMPSCAFAMPGEPAPPMGSRPGCKNCGKKKLP